MTVPREGMGWCWAGLATVLIAAIALTQAEDLPSATERIVAVDLGIWLDWTELRLEPLRWSFALTPVAAWWAAVIGALCAWIGWNAHRSSVELLFGGFGCLIMLASWGLLAADSLPLSWLFLTLQSWLVIAWLMRHRDAKDCSEFHPVMASQIAADVCGLAGVLLAGIAWGTFDIAAFRDPEFVHAGWQRSPLAASAAGAWVFLGFACRCAWFPWLSATRFVQCVSQWGAAMMLAGIVLPASGWWWFVVAPLLGCAPEIVALVQGMALLAALIAAFIAMAQTDRRRTALLLASMQMGLIASAAVLPGIVSPWQLATVVATISVTTAIALISTGGWQARLAWWMLAGGCLSPLFWTAGVAVERFSEFTPPGVELTGLGEDEASSDTAYRVRPLPAPTWVGVWCLTSFCGLLAARRAASAGKASDRNWIGMAAASALAVLAAWLAMDEIVASELWPALLAATAGLFGWLSATFRGRARQEIASPVQSLRKWAAVSQWRLFLDDGAVASLRRKISQWSASIRRTEDVVLPGLLATVPGDFAAWLKASVEELRREPPGVYAVAFVLVVGSLIVTWMWLVHRP